MKLVIFDCDGTIIDSQIGIVAAMRQAFDRMALPPPTRQQILGAVGLSLPETFQRLAGQYSEPVQRELAAIYKSDFVVAAAGAQCGEPLYDGARQVIDVLSARDDVVLAIATGKSQRGVARLLNRESWHGRFASIQTADENPSKPHPEMVLAAMRETGADPSKTVMIGDTTFDIHMAVNAGVTGIGVAWGYHSMAALQAAGASHICRSYPHLAETLDQLFHVKHRTEVGNGH